MHKTVHALASVGRFLIGGFQTRIGRPTGKTYPHSSTRQRARYARQLAAGQLNIGRVEVTPEPVKPAKSVKRPRKVAADV